MKKTFISLSLSTLVLFSIVIYLLVSRSSNEVIVYDKDMIEYAPKLEKPPKLADNSVTFPGFKEVTVTEKQNDLYIALANPKFNDADLQFTIKIDNEKKILKKTDLIKPGYAVTHFSLPKELTQGKHKINLEIRAFSSDKKQTQLTGVDTSFDLNVIK